MKESNESLRGSVFVSHYPSLYSQYLLAANRSASSAVPTYLVKLLLENCADLNEIGVASIGKDPEDLDGTALHLIEEGREDILQILLDYGADVNQDDCTGKTVMSRMEANGDEILSSMLGENGGKWR